MWNLPCAPTRTAREILTLGAAAVGMRARIRAVPFALMPALGLMSRFPREIADVGFTFDRPYQVDGRKFARRFGFELTPCEEAATATLKWFHSSNAMV